MSFPLSIPSPLHSGHMAQYHITCYGNHLEVRKPVVHISFHIWWCSHSLTIPNARRNHHIHLKACQLPPNPLCIASGTGKLLWPSKRFSWVCGAICRCPLLSQIPGTFTRKASVPSCLLVVLSKIWCCVCGRRNFPTTTFKKPQTNERLVVVVLHSATRLFRRDNTARFLQLSACLRILVCRKPTISGWLLFQKFGH